MMSSSDLRKNATLPNHLLKWTVIYGFFTSVSRYNPSLVCLNPENLSVLTRVSVGEKLLFFYKHQCLHSEKYHPATKCFTNKNWFDHKHQELPLVACQLRLPSHLYTLNIASTPIDVNRLRQYLLTNLNELAVHELIQSFSTGFKLCYEGPWIATIWHNLKLNTKQWSWLIRKCR